MSPAQRCFDTQLLLAEPTRADLFCDGGCCSLILERGGKGTTQGLPKPRVSQKGLFLPFTLHKVLVVQGTQGMSRKRSYAQGQELSTPFITRASFPLDPVKIPHLAVLGVAHSIPMPTCQLA